MARKNIGKDFLFSDDRGFITADDEGGESYRYSDGSGYYNGADGSKGYIYSDGSGYYNGADGSKGYIYSDGSGYYNGADGSKGYIYSDGSGYYRGQDDSFRYKRSDGSGSFSDHSANNEDSVSHTVGAAIGTMIGVGLAGLFSAGAKAVAKELEIEAQKEAEKKERARIRRENRRAWTKKHRKGIAIAILISIVSILIIIADYEIQMLTPLGYSSESLEGLKYTEAVQKLKESRFSNIHTKKVSDLTISREDEENLVTEVKLMFRDSFDEDTKYPSNLWITVVYHTVELYTPPITSKEAKGMKYSEVIEEFENIGFTNITTNVKYDIVTGWLTEDGEVESVTINGEKKFGSRDEFRLDAEIVVTYHTFKNNKPR